MHAAGLKTSEILWKQEQQRWENGQNVEAGRNRWTKYVCEKESDVPGRAGGRWQFIFLLSYQLASLTVLAVRWQIHCFPKFVGNHHLYALLFISWQQRGSPFFLSLFHPTQGLFFFFVSPLLLHILLYCFSSFLFLLFLLKSISFCNCFASSTQ